MRNAKWIFTDGLGMHVAQRKKEEREARERERGRERER